MTFRLRGSTPHPGRSTSGVGKSRRRRRLGARREPGGGGALPKFVQRRECIAPISDDCMTLQMSAHWALVCFKPRYRELRRVYYDDIETIVDDLLALEVPQCNVGRANTGAEHELRRRVALAVATLMNSEGIPVRYPPKAVYPRPLRATQIGQPWMRALLTGHV